MGLDEVLVPLHQCCKGWIPHPPLDCILACLPLLASVLVPKVQDLGFSTGMLVLDHLLGLGGLVHGLLGVGPRLPNCIGSTDEPGKPPCFSNLWLELGHTLDGGCYSPGPLA